VHDVCEYRSLDHGARLLLRAQLNALLQSHLPRLAAHFHEQQVLPHMYSAGWFMTG
jgi:hypothetical protein